MLQRYLLTRRQHLAHVEARKQDHGAGSRQGQVHHHRHPVDMEERRHPEEDIASRTIAQAGNPGPALQHVADEVGVAQHDALRRAARPARVLNQGQVVPRRLRRRGVTRTAAQESPEVVAVHAVGNDPPFPVPQREQPDQQVVGERREVRDIGQDQVPQVAALQKRAVDGNEAGQADQNPRARVPDEGRHFGLGQQRVDLHDHPARLQDAVVGDNGLRAIRQHERHPVAGFESQVGQRVTELVGEIVHLSETQAAVEIDEGGVVRVSPGGRLEEPGQRVARILQMNRDTRRVVRSPGGGHDIHASRHAPPALPSRLKNVRECSASSTRSGAGPTGGK